MGTVRAFCRSRRGGVVALVGALALGNACGGRSDLLPGDVEIGEAGRGLAGMGGGGRGPGGAAGSRPVGGAGAGGASGSAGTPTAGVAGSGGQAQESHYCEAGQRAVLYLLAEDEAILRVDADTLQTLTRVRIDPGVEMYSLAATDTGIVYATSVLDVYRVDPLSGQAVDVNLSKLAFASNGALSVGFSPADPVVFGDTLLLSQVVVGQGVDVYAAPVSSFTPLWRHRFDGMTENPELVVAPDRRMFGLLSKGFVEYDPGILSEVASIPPPGSLEGRSGDVAYLSGYLFAVYAINQSLSRLYRVKVMSVFEVSPIEELEPIPDFIIGIGAACEAAP
jgi:hypothetical protein